MMLWVCKVIYYRWCQNEEQCSTSATHATAPWVLLFGSHHKFYISGRCSSLMVIVLDSRLRSAGLSAGQVNVLCSWVKHFTLTVPLSIQDHKWVMANCWGSLMNCWEVTVWWTGFLPRREQKTRIGVSWMDHVAWIQILLYYTPWQPPLYHGFSPSFLWWLL